MRARPTAWMAATVSTVTALSCSLPAPTKTPLPDGPQVVDVTMREYQFVFTPPVHAGQTLFRVHNAGKLDHDIGLFALPDDMPPIDEQLRGSERRSVTAVALLPLRHPGEAQEFVYALAPGQRYAVLCFIADADRQTHAVKGMNAEFRPEGQRGPSPSTTTPATPPSPTTSTG